MTVINVVKIPLQTIDLSPGSHMRMSDVSWTQYEALLEELGKNRGSRLAYSQGVLDVMVPLPEHERAKIVIADLVKAILRFQRRPWEPLGSTTFKRGDSAGIEPDECFYIQNYQTVIGKERIDLAVDPPPDLAIESDVTSKTRIEAYIAIKVPELWIYDSGQLKINVLKGDDCYVDSETSLIFPDLPIIKIIPRTIEQAKHIGTSQALLEFEEWLQEKE
ncbi:MAG: Uma2 family endonuclease [Cyanobacteria bacterium P01_A01_bin.37]